MKRIVVDALQVSREPTGVGRQALVIGDELRDVPHVELHCAKDAEPLFAGTYSQIVTPIPSSRPRLRRIVVQQLRALREGSDVVHVALGDQSPLFTRARVVAVINDVRRLTTQDGTSWSERAWYRLMVRRAVKRADALLTISEFTRSELQRLFGRDAVVVAHHSPVLSSSAAVRADDAPLLIVGAARPYKGLDTVAAALALMERPPRVMTAGPSTELGWVDAERLEELYGEARALIAPSRYEGYDLPVAEALARGLPVVASAIPAHLEVGGDAIVTFPPGDAAALASALRTLEDPVRRHELGAASLARAHALASHGGTDWRAVILGQ